MELNQLARISQDMMVHAGVLPLQVLAKFVLVQIILLLLLTVIANNF
jgi:hypothetical protein